MSRKLVGGLAAAAIVAVVLVLVMRKGGEANKPTPAAKAATPPAGSAQSDPWAKSASTDDAEARAPRGFAPKWSLDVDPEGPLLLEGQVVDPEGRPVGGAQVTISSVPKRTATSEEDGGFSFDKLVGRTYVLTATSKELAGSLTFKLMGKSDPAVIHMTEGVTVTVKVSDDDKQPVAGAEVTSGELTVKTDDKGSAKLQPLHAGWIGVEVKAAGYALGNGLTTIGSPGGSGEITVTLHKGVAVTGRVVDEGGKPVAKAHISIDTNDWIGERGADSVETDTDGNFTFPAVPSGTHTVSAVDGEHEPAESAPVTVSNRPVSGVAVRMKTGGQISGTVVDKDGVAAPYATVRVAGTGARMWRDAARQATTDAKGKFELHGLARAKLQARAESDAAASKLVDVDLSADSQKKNMKLVLDVSGRIEGIVVDETGQPVAEVSVHAFPDVINGAEREGLALAGMSSAETDGAGKFTIHGLPDGPYRLWASRTSGGFEGGWGRQSVAAKTGDHAVKITLPAPGTLVGKLTMENGSAPKIAHVMLSGHPPTPVNGGAFTVKDLPPGKYDAVFHGPEFAAYTQRDIEIKSGKTTSIEVKVTRGRKLSGRVVDAQGAGVPGARVKVAEMLFSSTNEDQDRSQTFEDMAGVRSATTDQDGNFMIYGVPETKATNVIADHPDRGRSLSVPIPAGTDDAPPVTLVLRGYGSISGRVTLKGEPQAKVAVSDSVKGGGASALIAETGADGTFVMAKVPEGTHVLQAVQAQMMAMKATSVTVQVTAGKDTKVAIDIPVGNITLDVVIKAKPNNEVNAAQVFLIKGVMSVQNAKQLTDGLFQGGMQGMQFWFGGPAPSFTELFAGTFTVCSIPITGNMMDSQFQERIQENMQTLKVYCTQVDVKPSPAKQSITQELPAMTPLPDPGSGAGSGSGH